MIGSVFKILEFSREAVTKALVSAGGSATIFKVIERER